MFKAFAPFINKKTKHLYKTLSFKYIVIKCFKLVFKTLLYIIHIYKKQKNVNHVEIDPLTCEQKNSVCIYLLFILVKHTSYMTLTYKIKKLLVVYMAKNNMNQYKSKNGNVYTLHMSNTQKNFIPHVIERFTADFVTDINDFLETPVIEPEDSLKELIKCFNIVHKADINFDEYDFSGFHDRSNPKKPKVNSDNSSRTKALIDSVNNGINKRVNDGVKIDSSFYDKLKLKVMHKMAVEKFTEAEQQHVLNTLFKAEEKKQPSYDDVFNFDD